MAKSLKSEIPLETFSKVVGSIYDCALDPNRWIDTAGMIAQLVGSEICLLGVHDMKNVHHGVTFHVGVEERYERLYAEKYGAINLYSVPLQLVPVGKVVTAGMLVAEQEVLRSRFYQEFTRPQGVRDTIGFSVLRTEQRMGWLAANRLEGQPRYGDAEVRLLTLLSPHVRRAITISDVLNLKTIRSEVLEVTLNALTSGVYLADSFGRIIYTNRAAEQQIENGNVLRIENNRLVPIDRMARARLATVIDEAIAGEAATKSSGFSVALPAREGPGLVAAVLPLHGGERRNLCGAFAAMAAIFVQDPIVVPPFLGEAFAKLYGLTGSELRTLLAMAPGLSVKEAAELLGIGDTTARTHLQHIYGKTGTSKQTELLHLFMSSTPPVKAA
jgi:DNA-binding CsgD family transcriptional regulator/PAS domain-containing protein